jgi:hypothetical protein
MNGSDADDAHTRAVAVSEVGRQIERSTRRFAAVVREKNLFHRELLPVRDDAKPSFAD